MNGQNTETGNILKNLIKDHLMSISQKYTKNEERPANVMNDFRQNISNQSIMNQQLLDIIQKCQ